jgi:hypothetical protein
MKRQLTSGLFVAVLSTILACPSASRAVPSGRQLYTKVQQQVKGRARKELNKRLYKMHGIKFVDISQNGSHGDLNTSGRFAVNADAKVIEPSKLTEAQRRHIAANPQEIWVRTTATINLGGELSLPLGHLTLRPKAGTRIAVVKETTVNASGINSIVNRDGSLSEVFDSQVQMAKQAAARLKPITSLEDVKKHLPENGTVTLLVQGHVGMTASGGVSYRGDNSLGRLGMNLGVSVSAKNEGFYEVTLTRRSGNEAYVVVRKAKTSTVALALGLNARATVDFREALPAVSNSYLDKAVEKGEAKVRKNLQKYADHLHTRASLNLSDRQAFESTKAMTIDLDDNRVYQAEQRLRLRDATFDLGVKVGSITVAKRLSKGTAKQDTLTLDDGSRISYKRETIRGEQEGLLSSSSLFGFSEGARKAKEERITVVGRNGESLTYLAGEYSTQDNKTTSTERKRFRDVARLFGFSNQRPLGTSKASTRSMRYEIDDAGYRKLASYVSRGRLTEAGEIAIGQAIDAVAQRAFGSRGRLPFADPRLTKAQRAARRADGGGRAHRRRLLADRLRLEHPAVGVPLADAPLSRLVA